MNPVRKSDTAGKAEDIYETNAFRTEMGCRKPRLYVDRPRMQICSLILTLVMINPSGFQEIWIQAEIKADVQACLWEPLLFSQ